MPRPTEPSDIWRPPTALSRRQVLRLGTAGLFGAGAAALIGCGSGEPGTLAGTGTESAVRPDGVSQPAVIRLPRTYTACMAPLLFAEDYLAADGIGVEYVTHEGDYALIEDVATGKLDMGYYFIANLSHAVDLGLPIVMLGGAHAACFQIIATNEVETWDDLRGKRLGFVARDPVEGDYSFTSAVMQRIGIAPNRDVELVPVQRADLLTALGRTVDAIHTYLTYTLTLRAQGHVLLDSLTDEPWSQNLCCAFFAGRDFVEKNPELAKRGLSAMLKAVDHCLNDPESAAARFVEIGWVITDSYASRTLDELSLDVWRTHDPEAAIRFYTLQLYEAGLIKSTPEEIIAKGTDWRFLDELKGELAYRPGGSDWQLSFYCDPETGLPLRTALRPAERARRTT